jgi:hypothetical protein
MSHAYLQEWQAPGHRRQRWALGHLISHPGDHCALLQYRSGSSICRGYRVMSISFLWAPISILGCGVGGASISIPNGFFYDQCFCPLGMLSRGIYL